MNNLTKNLCMLKKILLGRTVLCLWQITRRCNFTCRICHIWKEDHCSENELGVAEIRNVMDRLKPLGPIMMTLAGGEPLLRNDISEIVKVVSRDHFCSIVTNGWFMTRDTAQDLYKNGLCDAMVSIDYATPGKHDEQRGRQGAFQRALAAVEYLRDSRPDRRHKVRILAVLMDDNIAELEGLLLVAEELGVSFALTLYSNHRGKMPNYFPPGFVSEYLLELKKRHPVFETATAYLASFDTAVHGKGVSNCGGGKTFINMDEAGGISRCIDRNDHPAGNPLTDTTADILSALERQRQNEPCTRCWTSCRGIADILTGIGGIRRYPDFGRTRRAI